MLQFLLCQITYIVCTKESQEKNHKLIKRNSHNTGPFLVPGMLSVCLASLQWNIYAFSFFSPLLVLLYFYWLCNMAQLQPEAHNHPSLCSGWRGRICRFGLKKAWDSTFWSFLCGHPVNVENHLSVSKKDYLRYVSMSQADLTWQPPKLVEDKLFSVCKWFAAALLQVIATTVTC